MSGDINRGMTPTKEESQKPRRKRWVVALCVLLPLLAVGVLGGLPLLNGNLRSHYVVVPKFDEGKVQVDVTFDGLLHPLLPIYAMAGTKYMGLERLVSLDEDGSEGAVLGFGPWRVLFPLWRRSVSVRYEMTLSVHGRHGYQGRVESDFAVMPTRLILWLAGAWGAEDGIEVEVRPPAGADVLCAWPRGDDGRFRPHLDGVSAWWMVLKGVVVAGPFDIATFTAGDQSIEVATHRSLEPHHVETIHSATQASFARMHKLLQFNMHSRYLNIFTPRASDRKRIFGASSSFGHVYEMDPPNFRQWELFAHRITHVFNRDKPYGLKIASFSDRWFDEAFASWNEITITVGIGQVSDGRRFSLLFNRYWNKHNLEDGGYRVAASSDWLHLLDHAMIEWLHYTKNPLIASMLDYTLRSLSGDSKRGLEAFFVDLYGRYGGHRGKVRDLQKELEAFAGQSLDTFFDRYVHGDWPLLPLWNNALVVAHHRLPPLVGYVDDVAMRSRPFGMMRSGRNVEQHRQALLREAVVVGAIKELALQDVPDALAQVYFGLAPFEREAVFAHRRRVVREGLRNREGLDLDEAGLDRWLDEREAAAKVTWIEASPAQAAP